MQEITPQNWLKSQHNIACYRLVAASSRQKIPVSCLTLVWAGKGGRCSFVRPPPKIVEEPIFFTEQVGKNLHII